MRDTTKQAVLVGIVLLAIALMADTVVAQGAGTMIDCYMSPGGAIEVCI